ncbi:hypothetical protein [Brucella sp. 10RB9215]|uniref:hypothetical protein n=1 Tax=Brucella sp. 10RB9215 TaxID=1149953 RepID=UPI00155A42F9|nr:hypothetical protein [Brucella sp. 10RB9215]
MFSFYQQQSPLPFGANFATRLEATRRNRSTRHKSGIAQGLHAFSRPRWKKPPRKADRLEALEKLPG